MHRNNPRLAARPTGGLLHESEGERVAVFRLLIGLYKTEVTQRRGPWRGFDGVEYATIEWVAWFNTQRLPPRLGHIPSTEYEEQFYRARVTQERVLALKQPSLPSTRFGSVSLASF